MKIIKVVELFAGVGGFRIGLEQASNKKIKFETIWNSQWEPGVKTQHASEIYKKRFGCAGHSCEDIRKVVDDKFHEIPEHNLLVGGFPCQDYSVARTANQANGLAGKKGVLWWSIFDILRKSGKNAPEYLLLENVDRLLKSPTKQRGRDFAVMLASLGSLNYIVEWRVINAAEYGFPQRRRRIFILAYKKGTKLYKEAKNTKPEEWLLKKRNNG
ncbi:MAG: DNA (cytosine-5-)-methyltransferase, partial [Candidatus Paceibacterota bacterium]